MRVAVTGGSGFIGGRLVERLADRGFEVVVVDVAPPAALAGREVCIADLTDLSQALQAIRGFEAVYHFAGLVLGAVQRDPYLGATVNIQGTMNVLEACRRNGVRKLAFASTVSVYDAAARDVIANEETPIDMGTAGVFGATKLAAERFVREYTARYGLEHVILRIGSTYGPGACTNVVRTFLDEAMRGEPLVIWGDGKRTNQYVHVDDVVQGALDALITRNETFNLVTPEVTSILDLATLLQRLYGVPIRYEPSQEPGLTRCFVSPDKAMRVLKWRYLGLEKGLRRTAQELSGREGHVGAKAPQGA